MFHDQLREEALVSTRNEFARDMLALAHEVDADEHATEEEHTHVRAICAHLELCLDRLGWEEAGRDRSE